MPMKDSMNQRDLARFNKLREANPDASYEDLSKALGIKASRLEHVAKALAKKAEAPKDPPKDPKPPKDTEK